MTSSDITYMPYNNLNEVEMRSISHTNVNNKNVPSRLSSERTIVLSGNTNDFLSSVDPDINVVTQTYLDHVNITTYHSISWTLLRKLTILCLYQYW